MRKDLNFYDKFPRLKKLVVGLEFEEDVSIEQKQKAFRSLVDILVKKGIYKIRIRVRAAGNGNYEPAVKVVTCRVKVR